MVTMTISYKGLVNMETLHMAKGKDVLYWINKYENKTHRNFFEDWDYEFYPLIHIFEDGSFFTYTVCNNSLEIGPSSLDYRASWSTIESITKQLGLSRVTSITIRNPKAYCKFIGSKLIGTKIIHDIPYYYMEKEVN